MFKVRKLLVLLLTEAMIQPKSLLHSKQISEKWTISHNILTIFFKIAKMEENMSTQIENGNKKIISKIMQIQLISNVSSVTVKSRRQKSLWYVYGLRRKD